MTSAESIPLPFSLRKFTLGDVIAASPHVVIRRGESEGGEAVAVKTIAREASEVSVLRLYQQAHAARLFRHPGLLGCLAADNYEGRHFLVTPWAAGGCLADRLSSGQRWSSAMALGLACDVAQALDVLHAAGLVLTSLDPAHVLFTEYGAPVLTGLGYATDRLEGRPLLASGRDYWTAPEAVACSGPLGSACDVYSLSRLVSALLLGQPGDACEEINVERLCRESIDCGAPLARTLVDALDPNPDRRHPTVYRFLWALYQAQGGGQNDLRHWTPLADVRPHPCAHEGAWYVLTRSRKRGAHRLCRGGRCEIMRLLLRGRLTGRELASASLSGEFTPLVQHDDFAVAAAWSAGPEA